MSAFVLKMIACATMLIDHIGYVFEPQLASVHPALPLLLRCIGRIAFPLFAFGIGEGAAHTSSPNKYLARMFIFALIAQLPYMLMTGTREAAFSVSLFGHEIGLGVGLSVMATLFFALCICIGIQEGKHLGAAIALGLAYAADKFIGMDYGMFGLLLVVGLYFARQSRPWRAIMVILFALCHYSSAISALIRHLADSSYAVSMSQLKPSLFKCAAMCVPAVLLFAYNGKKGASAKVFTYVFYPAHMLALWVVWQVKDVFSWL